MPTRFFASIAFLLALYYLCFFVGCLNSEAMQNRSTFAVSLQRSSRFADNSYLNYEHEKSSQITKRSAKLWGTERGINISLDNRIFELPPSRSYGIIDKLFYPNNSFIAKFKLQSDNTSEASEKNLLVLNEGNNSIEVSTKSGVLSDRTQVSSINSLAIEDVDESNKNINRSSIFIEFKKQRSVVLTNEKNLEFSQSLEKLNSSSNLLSTDLESTSDSTPYPTSVTTSSVLTSITFSRRMSLAFQASSPSPTQSYYGPPQESHQFSKTSSSYGPPSHQNRPPNINIRPDQSHISNETQNFYHGQSIRLASMTPETFYGLPAKTSHADAFTNSQQPEIPLISLTYGPSDGLVPPNQSGFESSSNSFNRNAFHKQRPSEEFLPPSVDLTSSFSKSTAFSGPQPLNFASNLAVDIYGLNQNRNQNRPLNSYESPILGYFFNKYH